MDDKIELTVTYSRAEILEWANKVKDMGGNASQTRDLLNQFFPAWFLDTYTSLTVDLMFRGDDPNDFITAHMRRKIEELEATYA